MKLQQHEKHFLTVLLGQLFPSTRKSVGILDLGGGSTQITFLPKVSVFCV